MPSIRPSSSNNILSGSISRLAVFTTAATLLLPFTAKSQTSSWTNGATGVWSDTTNWLGGIVADGAGNTADFSTIDLLNDATVHLDSSRTIGSLVFGDTTVSSAGGWLLDNNGVPANVLTLQTTPTITVNPLGTGKSVTISAILAGVDINKAGAGNLILSGANTYTGNLNINSGGITLTGSNNATRALFIRGVSSLTIDSGGSLKTTNNFSSMGVTAGDAATVTIKGTGSFMAGDADFNVSDTNGSQGTLFVQDNATLTVAGTFFVSKNQNTTGAVNLSGGSISASRNFIVGQGTATNGDVSVTGGSLSVNGETWIGNNGGGNGSLVQSGGAISGNNWFVVGRSGATGVYDMTGGTLTKTGSGNVILGDGGSSNGTLNLSGNASVNAQSEFWIGQNTGVGTMTVAGNSSLTATNWIAVGRANGTGTLNISGGTVTKAGPNTSHFIVGSLGGHGTVNQTGGTVNTVGSGRIRLGEGTSTALWDLSGGSVLTDGLEVAWAGGTNEFRIRDLGSLTAGFLSISVNGTGVVNQSGGTVNVAGTLDVQGAGGAGTYNLSGGSLSVDGNIDAVLGTFNFTGGRITRSNSGIITFDGALTTGTGLATLDLDNNKTFDINGAFNKTAGLTLDLTGTSIPAWDGVGVDTGSFTLGTVDSIAGTFGPATDTLAGLSIANPFGATFISEAAGEGGGFDPNSQSVYWVQESGGNVTLQYSVVPEPGSASLLALAGLAIGLRRRRG
jgi:autotransporter-associated beta strand protein/T5SS/PEP-CTERM-associated repeat protein